MIPRHRLIPVCLAAATLSLAACTPRPGIDLSKPSEQAPVQKEDPCQRHFYIAYEYYREKLIDDAIAKFQEAIQCNPKDTESMSFLGQIYREKEDYADAEKYLQQAVTLQPDSVSYREDYAWVLIARGKYEDGIAQYDQVIQRFPDNTDAWLNKGFAYERKARILRERAQAMMEDPPPDALEAEQKAIEAYTKVHELDPSNTNVLLTIGALYLNRLEYDKALDVYEQYYQKDPSNPEVIRTLAELNYETEHFPRAAEMYEILVKGDPARGITGDASDPEKWYRLAYSYDKAQEALKDSIAASSGAAKDTLQAERAADQQKADEAYLELLTLDPDRLAIYWHLGEFYVDMGRYDAAMAIVDRGLARKPKKPDDLANAYTMLGKALEKKDKYKEAIAKFEQVLDLEGVSGQWLTYAEKEIDRQKQLIKRAEAIRQKEEYESRTGGTGG